MSGPSTTRAKIKYWRPLGLPRRYPYSFRASTPAGGTLRPLRDPDATDIDEDGAED
ncbi:hypothetical protein [Actinacidiphila oryziradicis]|uniref:hypothetical protein n=1 Tax=Actinacidiphila oryziradicis TaxID=2571141 RepID=UPI00145EDCDD|nr:hypothetical protein [Actinacidiphila oryziradicis]